MDIIIKPVSTNLEKYIDNGINTFLFPIKDYAVEFINYYTIDEIKNIKEKYSNINIFVSINKNILNNEINGLEDILEKLDDIGIKGVFFYDIAVLSIKNRLNLKFDLVWNGTFMVTNYKTCDYYHDNGCKYALLSKEITKDEIIEIINNTKITPIVELISSPVIAFSKRHLVSHYYEYYNNDKKDSIDIVEPISKQELKVIEDNNGVSFISKKIMNGSSILKELIDNDLKYIYLKEDLIDHDIFIEVVKNIKDYIDNKMDEEVFIKKQNELIGRNTNFFYRKTIYKVK